MTVNKDEVRRLDANELLKYIERRQNSGDGSEELHMLAEGIKHGIFDAPPDAKDAEIARLREANELERRMYHELRAEWQKSEEARKAAERELELVRSTIADIEHNRKLNADEKAAAEQERDVWKNRHEDAKNDRDTFAREMNEWRRRARMAEKERDELRQELDNEKKVALHHEGRAYKSYHEILRLREELHKHRNAAELALTGQRAAEREREELLRMVKQKQSALDELFQNREKWRNSHELLTIENTALRECLNGLAEKILRIEAFADTEELTFPLENPTEDEQIEWFDKFVEILGNHVRGVIEDEIFILDRYKDAQPVCSSEEPCPVCAEGIEIYDRMMEDTQEEGGQ